MQNIYIASQDPGGGILHCSFNSAGKLNIIKKYMLDRPAYLAIEGHKLFALMREPFKWQSGVAEFLISHNGGLLRTGEIYPTHGKIASHLMVFNEFVYVANYLSSSTVRLPDRMIMHTGKSIDSIRQDCSHPHCITLTPDKKYICINDLGTDRIYICTLDLQQFSEVILPPGSGPRHLVFSVDGRWAFCCNELNSTVSVLSYSDGHLKYKNSFSTLPSDFKKSNAPSAIRISNDGKFLFIANRGHNSISIFEISELTLNLLGFISSHVSFPRDIYLLNNYLLCANEGTNSVCVYNLLNGFFSNPIDILDVICPWCIISPDDQGVKMTY